jgi:5-formyltetrahydrofolate cyclo-ligase
VNPEEIRSAKAAWRKELRARVSALGPAERRAEAAVVEALVGGHPRWQAAACVGLFVPLPDELPLDGLRERAWAEGRTVALPVWREATADYGFAVVRHAGELRVGGRYGIAEPGAGCPELPVERLDFVVVPGIAFDLMGRRLGRGRGFYDRLLAHVRGWTCGVGFGCQMIPEVPVEPHDLTLNLVVTARGLNGPAAGH